MARAPSWTERRILRAACWACTAASTRTGRSRTCWRGRASFRPHRRSEPKADKPSDGVSTPSRPGRCRDRGLVVRELGPAERAITHLHECTTRPRTEAASKGLRPALRCDVRNAGRGGDDADPRSRPETFLASVHYVKARSTFDTIGRVTDWTSRHERRSTRGWTSTSLPGRSAAAETRPHLADASPPRPRRGELRGQRPAHRAHRTHHRG